MLIMTKTTEADAGCYKVVATNDAGSAESLGWMAVFGMRERKRASYGLKAKVASYDQWSNNNPYTLLDG